MTERATSHPRVGIVMAGGSGERFWPLSTGNTPKQLLNLTHPTKSMLQEAIERLDGATDEVFVSTSKLLADPIGCSGAISSDHVLAEPAKRNTLGALVWVVAELVARNFEDASVAVVTADHFIGDVSRFRTAIEFALGFAREVGSFVTFGVTPTRPETGYGYIEISDVPDQNSEQWQAFRSTAFKEKPDFEMALTYLGSGKHLWNSGMFFFTVPNFIRELEQVQPGAANALKLIAQALRKGDHAAASYHFESVPNLSIDYAVMEKVSHIYTIPVNFPWDDVGAWDALERTGEERVNGNAVRGHPILIDVENSIIVQNDSGIEVAVLGVKDLVVVSTVNAVLVCDKSLAQRVREVARLISNRIAP